MDTKLTLLQPRELAVCQGLAKRSDLHGRRAQALLALNVGDSQTDAGTASGLSAGQVKYALYQFRQRRLEIFPAELLNSAKTAPPEDGDSSSTVSIGGPAVADEPVEQLSQEKGKTKPLQKTHGGKKKKKKKVAKLASTEKKKKKKKALKAEKESKSQKKKKKKKK
jgi:hypothetical protein